MAQGETQSLLTQQQQYAEVRKVQKDVALIAAAEKVGGSTDIDWPAYLEKIQATLPVGVTIVGVSLDQASPLAAYEQATAALQASRIATVTIQITSPELPSVTGILNGLGTLPGFADAQPGSINLDSGIYKADITMHLDAAVLSGRFDTQEGE